MEKRYIKPGVKKKLYARSGNQCAFPNCTQSLFGDSNLGEICHIEGLNPNSARFNPHLSDIEVNDYDNLILLCPTHHTLIDKEDKIYTVEVLRQMKQEHEKFVAQSMKSRDNTTFYKKLQQIFRKYEFDRIILEQSFDTPFDENFIDKMDVGGKSIKNLLNEECAENLRGKKIGELLWFSNKVDYISSVVAMYSHPNGGGFAIPSNDSHYLQEIRNIMKELRLTYKEYRFR